MEIDLRERTGRSTVLAVAGLVVTLALVAVALGAPPSLEPYPPASDASLIARVFPRLPPSIALARLALTALAVMLLSAAARPSWPDRMPGASPAARLDIGSAAVAIVAAAAGLAAWPVVRSASLAVQGGWLVALLLPPVIIGLRATRPVPASSRASASAQAWLLPIVVWFLWRVAALPAALRAADASDTWLALQRVQLVAAGEAALLTDSFLPGATNAYMLLEGIPLLAMLDITPSFTTLRWAHAIWTVVAALALGDVLRRRLGVAVAAAGVTAFLFSPFMLHTCYSTLPIFLGPLFTVVLLWLVERAALERCAWATAMIGPVAGLAATVPALVPVAGLAVATGVVAGGARRELRPAAVCLVLGFAAALAPSVPSPDTVARMIADYTTGSAVWLALERLLMGQLSPVFIVEAWRGGTPGILDVPVGALLSPWLAARTPMRLFGSSLFDPLTAVTFGVGIVSVLRCARGRREAIWLLLLLACAVAPGLLSSYDRPSHTRLFCAPVAISLIAAVGLSSLLSAAVGRRWRAHATVAWLVAVALLGAGLFDHFDARRLERSFLGVALAASRTIDAPARVVRYPDRDASAWMHFDLIVATFGEDTTEVVDLDVAAARIAAEPAAVWFVSPGLEQFSSAVRALCAVRPAARVAVLHDATGFSRAFAVRHGSDGWPTKLVPPDRIVPCSAWPADVARGDEVWQAMPWPDHVPRGNARWTR